MRWWPFRSREEPWSEVAVVGEPSSDPVTYSILTVGQSRLTDSFDAVGLTSERNRLFAMSRLTPIMDERLGVPADVTVSVEGHVVGYLRPPTVRHVMATRQVLRARTIDVPAVLEWSPAGPEVRLRAWSHPEVDA